MKFDLFISDFDGTLGMAPDIVEPETVEAIKKYEKLGGKFVICTGRMSSAIIPICKKYGLNGLVISYQGSKISDIETDTPIFRGGIDYETTAKVITDLESEGVNAVADIDDVMYCREYSEYTDFHKGFSEIVKVEDVAQKVLELKRTAYKVVATSTEEVVRELTKKYQEKYKGKLIVNNGGDRLLEVINPACSKGFAVKYIADYFKIPHEKIIAVGDSTNDIELIKGDWHGVAVGDGKPQLKQFAKEITVPYKEQPVKYLLEKYCL